MRYFITDSDKGLWHRPRWPLAVRQQEGHSARAGEADRSVPERSERRDNARRRSCSRLVLTARPEGRDGGPLVDHGQRTLADHLWVERRRRGGRLGAVPL